MTRVKPQFEKSKKVSGPRALQPSQVTCTPAGNLLDIPFLCALFFVWIEQDVLA